MLAGSDKAGCDIKQKNYIFKVDLMLRRTLILASLVAVSMPI